MTGGFDFNGDGYSDVVLGAPNLCDSYYHQGKILFLLAPFVFMQCFLLSNCISFPKQVAFMSYMAKKLWKISDWKHSSRPRPTAS